MDKIKNELYSVDIIFWEAFDGYLLNNLSKTTLLLNENEIKNEIENEIENEKVKTDLNKLFILLKFVIEKVNNILEADCSNSKFILNLLFIVNNYSKNLQSLNFFTKKFIEID